MKTKKKKGKNEYCKQMPKKDLNKNKDEKFKLASTGWKLSKDSKLKPTRNFFLVLIDISHADANSSLIVIELILKKLSRCPIQKF